MVRIRSDLWSCVICGKESSNGVVCYDCERTEKDKQRAEPGSITTKQLSYVEYLIGGLDSQTTGKIIFEAVPDYGGDLENLSANQAGSLIAKLLEIAEPAADT